MAERLFFDGWHGDRDKEDMPKRPWARFFVCLGWCAIEDAPGVGDAFAPLHEDLLESPEEIARALAASGYRITIEKIKD